MFIGEYYHAIDAKGRIVIPSTFRDAFADNRLMVTNGFDGCLNIYIYDEFKDLVKGISPLPTGEKKERDDMRRFFSKAMECKIDSQNRINLSNSLISLAELNKQCVFFGANNHIELWSSERWEAYMDNLNSTNN